jgi:DUF4097 and DUF4098 domain-containing protein YvlB
MFSHSVIAKLSMGTLFVSLAVFPACSTDANANRTDGAISISKMGGDIDVDEAPQGADLKTMGGNIHLGSVGKFATLKTMGGNIVVDAAAGPLHAATMGGNIDIGEAEGSLDASTMAGDITARLRGSSSRSSRDIELSSKAGEISLVVPKDFPITVEIELAYTKDHADEFRIVSDVGLDITRTAEWDYSHGSPRKYIYAKGHIGSGQNHVVIHTINGNVTLKQK